MREEKLKQGWKKVNISNKKITEEEKGKAKKGITKTESQKGWVTFGLCARPSKHESFNAMLLESKAGFHRFLSRNSKQFLSRLELQLQYYSCKPNAISAQFLSSDIAGVPNLFET